MKEGLTSLPPGLNGKLKGELKIELGRASLENTQFKLRFWGEKPAGVLLQPGNQETKGDILRYDIICSKALFRNYLKDMKHLKFEVFDSDYLLIGIVKVDLYYFLSTQNSLNEEFEIFDKPETQAIGKVSIKAEVTFKEELNKISEFKKVFVPMKSLRKIPKPAKPKPEMTFGKENKNCLRTLEISTLELNSPCNEFIYILVVLPLETENVQEITPKSVTKGSYDFEYASNLLLNSGKIKFTVFTCKARGKKQEIGNAELEYLAGTNFEDELSVSKASESVGTLKVRITDPNHKPPQSQNTQEPQKVPQESFEEEFVSVSSLQILLKLGNCKLRAQNVYFSYKTFPDSQKVQTPIYYDLNSIDHTTLNSIALDSKTPSLLNKGTFVIEVWSKNQFNSNALVGLVKLQLKTLTPLLESFQSSQTALVGVDEDCSVIDIKSSEEVGTLKVTLGIGTAAQVYYFLSAEKAHHKVDAQVEVNESCFESYEEHHEEEPYQESYQEPYVEPFELPINTLNFSVRNPTDLLKEALKNTNLYHKFIAKGQNYKGSLNYNQTSELILQECPELTLTETNKVLKRVLHNTSATMESITPDNILDTLEVQTPKPQVLHYFEIHLKELFDCGLLFTVPPFGAFVKLCFPYQKSYLESDFLTAKQVNPINISVKYNYKLPYGQLLDEVYGKTEGICIYLCRNISKCEEETLGKGNLPVENLYELSLDPQKCVVLLHSPEGTVGKLSVTLKYSCNTY